MAFSPQPANNNPCPGHADGFKTLIMPMRDEGITQEQLDMMVRTTPAWLLGLEPW